MVMKLVADGARIKDSERYCEPYAAKGNADSWKHLELEMSAADPASGANRRSVARGRPADDSARRRGRPMRRVPGPGDRRGR